MLLSAGPVSADLQMIPGHIIGSRGKRKMAKGSAPLVLIVDDDHAHRLMLVTLMEDWGYRAQEAEDGRKASDAIRDHAVDLILMDMRMPNMDGMTAIEKLQDDQPEISVVILCACTREELAEILDIRDLLRDLRMILILPDRESTTLAQGLTLRPLRPAGLMRSMSGLGPTGVQRSGNAGVLPLQPRPFAGPGLRDFTL